MKKLIVPIILVILALQTAKAQHFTHDIGFHAGTATIQNDYGVRGSFLNNYGSSAISLSLTHTMHFFNRDLKWNAHHKLWSYLALRNELNVITNANFHHYGPFIHGNGISADKFRAMTGTVAITNIGFQLEYYMRRLKDFIHPWSEINWNPYVLIGFQYTMFNNTLHSTLGNWEQDISVIPDKWTVPGALNIGKGTTYAATFGGGVRYKFSRKIDFNLQLNWQFFLSDAIDGLQADVIENRYNELLLNFQFGVIYHLNFSDPLSMKF